ncbi:MAG: hypothetical protein AAF587_24015 [Bacteroidota bacterium]
MKNWSTLLLSFSLTLLITLSSCNLINNTEELITPEWAPEIAIPLVDSDISLQLLIEEGVPDTLITSGPEEVITLAYQTELITVEGQDIFVIPDIPIPMFQPEVAIPFPVGDLNQIQLKSGQLTYRFSLPDDRPVELNLRIPDAYKYGTSFSRTLLLQGSGTYHDSVDLEEYVLDLTDDAIVFQYEAIYRDDQSVLNLQDFQYDMKALEQQYVDGHFGTISLSLGSDSTAINITSELLDAGFRLEDPRLGMIFYNSMGIPIQLQSEKFDVITQEYGTVSLLTDSLEQGMIIAYPGLQEVGQTKVSAAYLNKDNSQLPEALSGRPTAFDWDFGIQTHPNSDPEEHGFLTDSSAFRIDLWAEVPLHGSLTSYSFDTEFEADLTELERVSTATIALVTENGIPVDVFLQAYFMDEQGMILDSLFAAPRPILASPSLSSDGSVIAPAKEQIDIEVSEDRIPLLLPTHQIRLHIRLGTSGGGQVPVKFYPENSLGIKLGVKGKLNL